MSSYDIDLSEKIVHNCWHAKGNLDEINAKISAFLEARVTKRSIEKVQLMLN